MAKTKRFNSNYRKNFKGGSRKRIPKKGKRRLNKSKSTKRRYKKSKNLKINRQLIHKRLQKGGRLRELSVVFETNEDFDSIQGLWFFWVGRKKGKSLGKISSITEERGQYKVTLENIQRNDDTRAWFSKSQYFQIIPGIDRDPNKLNIRKTSKSGVGNFKLGKIVKTITQTQGYITHNLEETDSYKDFFEKFKIIHSKELDIIFRYYRLYKKGSASKGFTLIFKPTPKFRDTSLAISNFENFILSFKDILRKSLKNASVNSTKMYYLIDDTKTKKFKIQSNLVITEYNHLSEDSFLKRTNFGDEMVMFTSDTTGTQEKNYSTYKQPNPLKFFIRKESTGKITLTYNSETYTVNDTLPDDTDDYILLE